MARARLFNVIQNNNYRDLATISTGVALGALSGVVESWGEEAKKVVCDVLCDSAYGAYAGIGISVALHGFNYYLNRTNRVGYDDVNDVEAPESIRPTRHASL